MKGIIRLKETILFSLNEKYAALLALHALIYLNVLTFRGTDRQTSRPSLISPNSLSVEQDRRSFSKSWYLVILKLFFFIKDIGRVLQYSQYDN